jgi:hypothetical protein
VELRRSNVSTVQSRDHHEEQNANPQAPQLRQRESRKQETWDHRSANARVGRNRLAPVMEGLREGERLELEQLAEQVRGLVGA